MNNEYRKWGLITGNSLLIMALIAGFTYGYVHTSIYIPNDSELTAKLLQENIMIYKMGIFAWVIIIILDIIVSLGLYKFYLDDKNLISKLSSALRILYTIVLAIAVAQLVFHLIEDSEVAKTLSYFEKFERVWALGLIIFGFHLLTLSIVCFKSEITPQLLAIFLSLGGLCYVIVNSLKTFFPSLTEGTKIIENILITPMALSELSFAIWLIVISLRMKRLSSAD